MSAHTPGPWTVGKKYASDIHQTNGNLLIARVMLCNIDLSESFANARLIAATPELLEELNNCFDLLNTCFPDAPVDSCIGVAIIKARAALDKAVQS